jgi:hypothetical protein
VRVVFVVVLVVALSAGVAALWHREGSPVSIAKRGWHAFQAPAAGYSNGNVGARLTSFSADSRIPLWRVSWRDFEAEPILGQGAGTFWEDWVRYRTIPSAVTQPHSLYLGVMGELGIVGLLILLAAVTAPILGAVKARARPIAPLTFAAYVAWAAHAGIDWDWALLGVTAPALLCGVALLKLGDAQPPRLGRLSRAVGVALCVLLVAVAGPILVSDLRLKTARADLVSKPAAAVREARRAHTFAPWSSEPYVVMWTAYTRERATVAARRALDAAIAKDPSNWMLWATLTQVGVASERTLAKVKVRTLNFFETP